MNGVFVFLLKMPHFKQSNCVFLSTKCMGNGVYFQRRMSVCSWTRVLITAPTPKDPSNVPVTEITKTSMATVSPKVAAALQTLFHVSVTTSYSVKKKKNTYSVLSPGRTRRPGALRG